MARPLSSVLHRFWWKVVGCWLLLKMYLFVYCSSTVAGLCCSTWAFSSCCVQASYCSGFSCCRAQAVGTQAWVLAVRELGQWGRTGLAVPWHVGSFWTRDQTDVSYIARKILNHWTTREALKLVVFWLLILLCVMSHFSRYFQNMPFGFQQFEYSMPRHGFFEFVQFGIYWDLGGL